jgi:hypothetical protein
MKMEREEYSFSLQCAAWKEKYYAVDSISACFGCCWGGPMGD